MRRPRKPSAREIAIRAQLDAGYAAVGVDRPLGAILPDRERELARDERILREAGLGSAPC